MPKRVNKSKKPKVSIGDITKENLPYPIVYYPKLYGAFFCFSKDSSSPTAFCSCSSTSIKNYLKLKALYPSYFNNMDFLRNSNLSSRYFPEIISEEYKNFDLEKVYQLIRFEKDLCHKCNSRSPTMTYCLPMYGGNFKQQWGWYVKQTYLRLGIAGYYYLPEACPDDIQKDIEKLKVLRDQRREEKLKIEAIHQKNFSEQRMEEKNVFIEQNKKWDVHKGEVAELYKKLSEKIQSLREVYKFKKESLPIPENLKADLEEYERINQRLNELTDTSEFDKQIRTVRKKYEVPEDTYKKISQIRKSKKEISLEKKIENITRQELGFKKIGEGWVSELILFKLVSNIFKDENIERHYRPEWLERLELDIYLPNKKLAFEYQGQQHYKAVKAWGGEKGLEKVQFRDAKKEKLCKKAGILLIKFDYTEPLSEEYLKEKIKNIKEIKF